MAELAYTAVSLTSVLSSSTESSPFSRNVAVNPVQGINIGAYEARPFREDWGVLSGTVSADGTFAQRAVVAIKRSDLDTSELRTESNAATGAFSLSVPSAGEEYIVVCLGNTGENAAIFDRVVP